MLPTKRTFGKWLLLSGLAASPVQGQSFAPAAQEVPGFVSASFS